MAITKVRVNSPLHTEFHGKEMYVIGIDVYKNAINQDCIWYRLSFSPGALHADLYLGKYQVIDADNETLRL